MHQRDLDPMPRRASLQQFEDLWDRCLRVIDSGKDDLAEPTAGHKTSVPGEQAVPGAEMGADLIERYKESGRYYHTLDHIEHCLGQFDRVRAQCRQADAVELAIWFHDAIYNFPAYENEKLSAAFFMEKSENLLATKFREDVADLVIATEHIRPPEDADQRILVDVDLSSFGLPWEQFAADGKNIRQELHYLTDPEFYSGQIAFMKTLLARVRIFNTEYFYENYEEKARENVQRYLSGLAERGFVVDN